MVVLAQGQVLALRPFLGPLLIVNIDACTAPAGYTSMIAEQRINLIQKPTVFSIMPAHPDFLLKRLSTLHCLPNTLLESQHIFRMSYALEKLDGWFWKDWSEKLR